MNYKIYSLLSALLIIIISCSKMNDMHQMYLDDGEKLYAAKLDSVAPNPGFNRIEFEMYALSQRINKVRIYWNDKNDSVDVMLNNKPGIYKQLVSNLEEGEYIFFFVSFDDYNNRSLDYELTAICYGDSYASILLNRSIENITKNGGNIIIKWRSIAGTNVVSTQFTYQTSTGESSEIAILPGENTTTLTNAKEGGTYSYKTLYKPTPNSIDTFASMVENGVFP
ncbi:DUF4998 domain-containing protein [Proteiniphilum sp.]|uniref:DUF4998 domain-containing protein n=1 Tax=Proteiniphilum sp. TaxID=1926877 RepID=UPI002B21D66C|nr:DUF4998 domain-containing protein [Proteiniphilum sp.]MEA4916715.1 DUF4998 domain-containing protein [Proteiniphilum sp.]